MIASRICGLLVFTLLGPCLCDVTCPLGTESPVNRNFGTKTVYSTNRGVLTPADVTVQGCTPDKLIAVFRHGIRYPGDGDIEDFSKLLLRIENASQSVPGLESLLTFNYTFVADDDKQLSQTGMVELEDIAHHLQTAFPSLLDSNYDESQYVFRHSYKDRARDSAISFANGLFGSTKAASVKMQAGTKVDHLLRPYDQCAKSEERDDSEVEASTFLATATVTDLVRRVNCRLNQSESFMSTEEVFLLMEQCFYDLAIVNATRSPLCLLLDDQDHRVYEYLDDVEQYYLKSYDNISYPDGFNSIIKNYCELYGQILETLKNESSARSTLYFGHSETVLPFITGLGYDYRKNVEPPSYYEYLPSYQQKLSYAVPLGANAVLVRYACAGNSPPVIKFFLNEHDVTSVTKTTETDYSSFMSMLEELADCTNKVEACLGLPLKTDGDNGGASSLVSHQLTPLLLMSLILTCIFVSNEVFEG